jgi:hypothetical protein
MENGAVGQMLTYTTPTATELRRVEKVLVAIEPRVRELEIKNRVFKKGDPLFTSTSRRVTPTTPTHDNFSHKPPQTYTHTFFN